MTEETKNEISLPCLTLFSTTDHQAVRYFASSIIKILIEFIVIYLVYSVFPWFIEFYFIWSFFSSLARCWLHSVWLGLVRCVPSLTRFILIGRQEKEEGRPYPVPRLGTDVAAAREPRRKLENGHDRRHQSGRHQLRGDPLHSTVSKTRLNPVKPGKTQ